MSFNELRTLKYPKDDPVLSTEMTLARPLDCLVDHGSYGIMLSAISDLTISFCELQCFLQNVDSLLFNCIIMNLGNWLVELSI